MSGLGLFGDPHTGTLRADLDAFAFPGVHFGGDADGAVLVDGDAAGDDANGEGEIAFAFLRNEPDAAAGTGATMTLYNPLASMAPGRGRRPCRSICDFTEISMSFLSVVASSILCLTTLLIGAITALVEKLAAKRRSFLRKAACPRLPKWTQRSRRWTGVRLSHWPGR